MKTKTLVLVGIAMCAILLASPVLASAGYSKIYGNANEDDVLDMRDVTYIKLVIFGKKPATTFADANYDGKISMLDIGQTKLIILGKEKKLTLIDMADRTVTIPRPVERVVAPCLDGIRTLLSLGAVDKLEGVGYFHHIPRKYFMLCLIVCPRLAELPHVGYYYGELNRELIVSLKPDVFFIHATATADELQESIGTPVVCVSTLPGDFEASFEIYKLIGQVIGREKEAEELISYAKEKIAEIAEVTSQIPDSEKPIVFLTRGGPWGESSRKTPVNYAPIDLAGGINLAGECSSINPYGEVTVSKEQIIAWNPDIILVHGLGLQVQGKYAPILEGILSDPDLQTVNAVKNRKVYYTKFKMSGWDPATGLCEVYYMAKLFHPEEFEERDVEEEGNDILKRFYGVEGLYTEMAEQCGFYRWE